MILASTSAKVQIRLSYTVAANQLPIVACWADCTTTTMTMGNTALNTNNVTDVDAVPAPAASTQRVVKSIHVYNDDTTQHFVLVTYFDGSTQYPEQRVALNPKDTLFYTSELGWYIIDQFGALRVETMTGGYLPTIRSPAGYIPAAAATNKTLTSGTTFARYLGRADRDFTACNVLWRVASTATVTWGELALATGTYAIGGNATLTLLGSALNIATDLTTATLKSSTLTATGKIGDHLWLLIGNLAGTPAAVQADRTQDFNQNGWIQSAVARPSTMAASTAFTLGSTSDKGVAASYQLV